MTRETIGRPPMSGQVSPFFPTIDARNLEGRRFRLPANFATELSLAVVSFERWRQELVDSWTPTLEILAAKHAGLRVYELPIISTRYRLARPFIDGGMAAAIHSRAARERTLTAYTSVETVLRALYLPNAKTIAVVLVDRSGYVYWRALGSFDSALAVSLTATIDRLTNVTQPTVAVCQPATGSLR